MRVGPDFRFFEAIFRAADLSPFRAIASRDDPAKYVVIIAVCDYTRILCESAPGILSVLTAETVGDIRAGRARLLLDLSNEGPAFYAPILSRLNGDLDHLSIPAAAVTFICQNRLMQDDYRASFPQRPMRFWSLDYFPSVIMAAFNGGANAQHLGEYAPLNKATDKLYTCLNAAPRWHRVLMYRWLQQRRLLDDGLVSFHGLARENPKAGEIDITAPPAVVAAHFGDLLPTGASDLPTEPIRFDASEAFGNALAGGVLVDAYARSLLSIVTESDFFETRTRRVTEKTVKALVMGHPFIVVGPAGSVALVESLGFRSFSAAIDHGYDRETDDAKRFSACLRTIESCLDLVRTDRDRWIRLCRDDADFNFRHGAGGFAAAYRQDLLDPILGELRAFLAS